MKLRFTKPSQSDTFHADLLRYYWMTHGVFFCDENVTCTYNNLYDFWDVTVKRGCLLRPSNGRGTVAQQECLWQDNIHKLQQIHAQDVYKISDGWTWEPLSDNTHVEGQSLCNGKVSCPTVRFWFYNTEEE
jgi:hypothetical protein